MVSWCFGSCWFPCTFQFKDAELRVFSKAHKWPWALLKCEKLQTRFLKCCMRVALLLLCLHPAIRQKFCGKGDLDVSVEWRVIPLRFGVNWGFDHETSQIGTMRWKEEKNAVFFQKVAEFLNIYPLEPRGNLTKPPKCFPELLLHGSILKAVMQALAYSQNRYFQ